MVFIDSDRTYDSVGHAHQAFARASELIDYLGLAERAAHRPSQLSGGERQ